MLIRFWYVLEVTDYYLIMVDAIDMGRLANMTKQVLKNGTVVERGTHEELIGRDGRYASMWRKQSRAQKAREEAEQLRDKARQKLKEAEVDSASVTEDEAESSPHGRTSSKGLMPSGLGDNGGSGKPPGHP